MRKWLCVLAVLAATTASAAPRKPAKTKAAPAKAATAAPAEPGKPDRPWTDDVLYFVILDRFADGDLTNDKDVKPGDVGTFHGGDLKGLTAHLDDIADLGATAIWVTPLVQQIPSYVVGAGFPDWGYHGYWADDYDRLDPRFGTEEDLATLVREAHRRGIKVLLDVVYNHTGYDSQYLANPKTKEWLRSQQHGGCGDPEDDVTNCVAGLPDWKTEEPQVRDWLLKEQLQWPKRIPLDGFRLDTVKHVDHAFWDEHRKRTRAELGKGFFLLGEVYGGNTEWMNTDYFGPDELDAALDFTFAGSAVGFVMGSGRAAAFNHYLLSREKALPGHIMAQYLSSHDVRGALDFLNGDKELFRLAALLELTSSGLPVIMYGEEVGSPIGAWPNNRPDYPWGNHDVLPGKGKPRDDGLRAFYRKVIGIRRSHPALLRGKTQGLVTEGDTYVFQRREPADGDAVVVMVNRSKTEQQATFPAPQEWKGAKVQDLLSVGGDPVTVQDGKVTIGVGARQARILGIEWNR